MKTLYLRPAQQRVLYSVMSFFAAALLLFGFASIAAAKGVSTALANPSELQGTYSVITYGCTAADDPATVAILQKEDTPYTFNFVAPVSQYNIISGLRADDALRQAEDFVQCGPSARQTELTKIYGPEGTVIGYEVKPVFTPLRYGSEGVDTHYKVEGNKVLAYVTTDPLLQQDWMGTG